jgi:NAD(P) transhydrogenase
MELQSFDLVVIGGGPAGSSGAVTASIFGKSVALVEKEPRVGGAGLNTGTIPSKALRESALVLSGWKARKLLGVDVALRRESTVPELAYHADHVREALRNQVKSRLSERGVEVFHGTAVFTDSHTIRVVNQDGQETLLNGKMILVATGSSPVRPAEFPFEHPRVHDSDEILEITTLPKKLAVVGAGVIGAEYACTFAALSVEVHLVDGRDILLPFLDHEVSAAIERGMRQHGVQFHWNEKVVRCTVSDQDEITLGLSSGGELVVTDVLVAFGRSSNTAELDLSAAGLAPGKRGLIPVNAAYQTEISHIYAAGDVIGPPALAAASMEQARVAVCHAFGMLKKEGTSLLPTGIYTIPEASMAGQTEREVRQAGIDYLVGRASYSQNPRGRLIGDENGFLKLIFRRDDLRLLGVHVVGEQATELVHVGLIALIANGDAEMFNRACFNYPTLGDLYKYATYDVMLQRDLGLSLGPKALNHRESNSGA